MSLTVIDHYNQTLSAFKDNEKQQIQFLLHTAHLVKDYLEEEENSRTNVSTPKPFVKSKWRNTTRVHRNQRLEMLKKQYFDSVGLSQAHQSIAPPVSDNRIANERQSIESPVCCDTPNILMLVEHAICASCGRKVNDSTQFVHNTNDISVNTNRIITLTNASDTVAIVDKTGLVNRSLLRLQGIRVSNFKENEWNRLYKNVTSGIAPEDIKYMSCSLINRKLSTADKKYSKDIYVIWEKITGQRLYRVPDAVLWLINHKIANQIVVPLTDANAKQPRILAMTLLYKCFQLCGEKKLLNIIVMQHAAANMATFTPVWRLTCDMHGLKYMV